MPSTSLFRVDMGNAEHNRNTPMEKLHVKSRYMCYDLISGLCYAAAEHQSESMGHSSSYKTKHKWNTKNHLIWIKIQFKQTKWITLKSNPYQSIRNHRFFVSTFPYFALRSSHIVSREVYISVTKLSSTISKRNLYVKHFYDWIEKHAFYCQYKRKHIL